MFFFFFNFDDVENKPLTRSANKGEWSEVYTMFKLLGEGKLFAGDENYNRIENRFFPILNIIREEVLKNKETETYDYEVVHKDNNNYSSATEYVVVKTGGRELLKMSAQSFLEAAEHLLGLIKEGKGRSFKTSSINEAFMNKVHCRNIKRDPGHKADIELNMYDFAAQIDRVMGMSIKSLVGGSPTLLNTSDATLITYSIEDADFSDADIDEINSIEGNSKLKRRIEAIYQKGAKIVYKDYESRIFKSNLDIIDSALPRILAETVLLYFSSKRISSSSDLITNIAKKNPLDSEHDDLFMYYKAKYTRLLESSALGMYPATRYDDSNDAKGYVVVRDDGDIVCYSFYDREMVRKHLFDNTKMDTPSSEKDGRKDYCKLYRTDDGNLEIQLNFQIRWK